MKKIVLIIMSLIMSIAIVGSVEAKIVFFEEYVTKAEVKQYIASASEMLEKITSLEHLTPIFDKNPTLRYIKDQKYKEQQKQAEGGGN